MMWDGKTLGDVVKNELYRFFANVIPEAVTMKQSDFVKLMKKKHQYSGGGGNGIYIYANKDVTLRFYKEIPELDGDREIILSWSQAARFIRAWEYERTHENLKAESAETLSTVQEQWDKTHLCGDYYGEHCEFLIQAKDDTVMNGKKLDSWCPYCTSENKVRKIGTAGMWTGISPKFCLKRKAAENKEDTMARKLQFDSAISADIKAASADSFVESIKMLDVSEIEPSKENFYEMSNIELLADDIEREGLKHNLVVSKDKNGDKYWLKSGHRRFAAVNLLIEQKRLTSTKIPCYVDGEKTKAESKLDLIMLNATQRKYTDAEVMSEYEQLSRTLKELDNEGKGLSGRMRENIATILNISNGQVGKLDNIKHNAVPEIQSAIKSGEMSISTANEVAKLAPEKQKEVVEKKPDITTAEVKKMQDKKPTAPPKPKSDKAPNNTFEQDDPDDTLDEDLDDDDFDDDTENIAAAVEPVVKSEKGKALTYSLILSEDEAKALLEFINDNILYADKDDELVTIQSRLENFIGV